jgi:hypothetical protein
VDGGHTVAATIMSPCWNDALTIGGFIVGAVSLALTGLIYRWTGTTDSERHEELLEAVREMAALLPPGQPPANLGQLSQDEQAKLRGALQQGENVLHVARSATGKGNHPWRAITSQGRVLQVYTGGRRGGVHLTVVT